MQGLRRFRRWAAALAAVLVSVIAVLGAAGYFLFLRPHVDPLAHADAVVVLGGDPDGRLAYGLDIARRGYANTVVLSNSYGDNDSAFQQACASGTATMEVICFTPDPYTTRGEAMFTAGLAAERGWRTIILVSWNFHMIRARYIFHQCGINTVIMRPVPGTDHVPPWYLVPVFAYQYGAMVKAAVVGC